MHCDSPQESLVVFCAGWAEVVATTCAMCVLLGGKQLNALFSNFFFNLFFHFFLNLKKTFLGTHTHNMEPSTNKRRVIIIDESSSEDEELLVHRRKKTRVEDAPKVKVEDAADEYDYASSILKQHIELKKAMEDEIRSLHAANAKCVRDGKTLEKTVEQQTKTIANLKDTIGDVEKKLVAAEDEISDLKQPTSPSYSPTSPQYDPAIQQKAEAEVKDMYITLMEMAIKRYKLKDAAISAEMMKAAKPPVPSAPAVQTIQMYQKNTSGYSTERLVTFEHRPNVIRPIFRYDTSVPPCNWQPLLADITDDAVLNALHTLGGMTYDVVSKQQVFTPVVGRTASYTIGSNTYTVTVELRDKPVQPPPPPNGPAALNLAQQMMFKGDFCNYDPVILQSMRNGFNTELNLLAAPDQTITVSSSDPSTLDAKLCSTFAAMATMFSSYGQGFVYDSTSVQLWLKPTWIHAWLRRATESEYNQFCIGAHGSQTNDYKKFEKDMSGHDLYYHKSGRIGVGMYVSRNDSIATEYNYATTAYPKGSFEIGLQLLSPHSQTKPAPQHGSSSIESNNGAYTIFHYGTYGVANGTNGNTQLNDAMSVRDPTTWLPLGVVIPAAKKKTADAPKAATQKQKAVAAVAAANGGGSSSSASGASGAGPSGAGPSGAASGGKKRGRPRKNPVGP